MVLHQNSNELKGERGEEKSFPGFSLKDFLQKNLNLIQVLITLTISFTIICLRGRADIVQQKNTSRFFLFDTFFLIMNPMLHLEAIVPNWNYVFFKECFTFNQLNHLLSAVVLEQNLCIPQNFSALTIESLNVLLYVRYCTIQYI